MHSTWNTVSLGACMPAGVIFRINQAMMPPETHPEVSSLQLSALPGLDAGSFSSAPGAGAAEGGRL